MSDARTAAVTGANGYVGSRIVAHLKESGFRMVELRRDATSTSPPSRERHFALDEPVSPELLTDVDLLVHVAYDFRPTTWAAIEATNVQGWTRLLDAAVRAQVSRVLLISTMSSFEASKSLYGRAKLAMEADTLRRGGGVIRPGLVFGPDPGGMVGKLNGLVQLPVQPLIGSGAQVLYCAHSEDLGCLVVEMDRMEEAALRKPVIAASERGLTLRAIIDVLAEAAGRKARVVAIPWRLVWAGLKMTEALGVPLGLRSDSVVSLINQDEAPDFAATRRAGVNFRDFEASTALS